MKSGDTSKSMESGTNKYFIEIKQVLINISLGWGEENTTYGTVSLEEGRLGGWGGRLFGQKLEIIARWATTACLSLEGQIFVCSSRRCQEEQCWNYCCPSV